MQHLLVLVHLRHLLVPFGAAYPLFKASSVKGSSVLSLVSYFCCVESSIKLKVALTNFDHVQPTPHQSLPSRRSSLLPADGEGEGTTLHIF